MAFHPITLEYDSSIQGSILKNRDDQAQVNYHLFIHDNIKYRAVLRSKNIDKHFNSNYNILTGEDRSVFKTHDRIKQISQL